MEHEKALYTIARNIATNLTVVMVREEIDDEMLSEWCGLHPRTVSNYRNGTVRQPMIQVLRTMADVLRVTIDWLITHHEEDNL